MHDESVALLTQRLERLEQANRRLRHSAVAALLLAAVGIEGQLLVGAQADAQTPRVLVAEEILLVKDGDTRARLYVDPVDSTVRFSLLDGRNGPSVLLTANTDGAEVIARNNPATFLGGSVTLWTGRSSTASVMVVGDRPDVMLYGPVVEGSTSMSPSVVLSYNPSANAGAIATFDQAGSITWLANRLDVWPDRC